MTDDTIAGIAITAGAGLLVLVIALYWMQRLRFTRGDDPIIVCSVRWWRGPLGLGWRQALIRLGKESAAYRRRISFRSTPELVLPRSALTFVGRGNPRTGDWMWVGDSDVITVATGEHRLELAFMAGDGDVFFAWLGIDTPHPAEPANRRPTLILTGLSLLIVVAVFVLSDQKPWALLAFPAGIAIWTFSTNVAHRRVGLSRGAGDEFVMEGTDVFSFLQDFGFDDAYVQHFPWETTLVFTGTHDRLVVATLDRRAELLEVAVGRRDDEKLRSLRGLLEEAGHPDPGRVTRYTGEDGPLRKALDANAHALRLWGRPFLVGQAGAAGAAPGAV